MLRYCSCTQLRVACCSCGLPVGLQLQPEQGWIAILGPTSGIEVWGMGYRLRGDTRSIIHKHTNSLRRVPLCYGCMHPGTSHPVPGILLWYAPWDSCFIPLLLRVCHTSTRDTRAAGRRISLSLFNPEGFHVRAHKRKNGEAFERTV